MNDGILHDKDEPKKGLPRSGLMSMLDILGGGDCTCDQCGRWQSVSALHPDDARERLKESGWTFNGKDLCPICSSDERSKP